MPERAYFGYVMRSPTRTLYAGVTDDLECRVAEHKEGKPGSFTAGYNVTLLVYFERFDYIRDAIARENGIERMLRAEKIALNRVDEPAVAGFERRVKRGGKRTGILREARGE